MTREEYAAIIHGETFAEALNTRPRPCPPEEVQRIKDLEAQMRKMRMDLLARFGTESQKRFGMYETEWQRLDTDVYFDSIQERER